MQRTNLRNVICLPELVCATRGEGGRAAAATGAAAPACVCVRVVWSHHLFLPCTYEFQMNCLEVCNISQVIFMLTKDTALLKQYKTSPIHCSVFLWNADSKPKGWFSPSRYPGLWEPRSHICVTQTTEACNPCVSGGCTAFSTSGYSHWIPLTIFLLLVGSLVIQWGFVTFTF